MIMLMSFLAVSYYITIERYHDIINTHPVFEKISRKSIFEALLSCVDRAIQANLINEYRDQIENSIRKVQKYSVENCGLLDFHKTLLYYLYNNINRYISGKRLMKNINKKKHQSDYLNNSEINGEDLEILNDTTQGAGIAVSVIIPVYNSQNYINECLVSVINQSLTNIEIICIDDGSTDDSLNMLNQLKKKDNRVIVVSQENQGAALARNKGMAIARGEYIAFMDSDDCYPSTNCLSELYSCAKKHNVMICGGKGSIEQNGVICDNNNEAFDIEGEIKYIDYQGSQNFTFFIYSREMLINNDVFFPNYRQYEDPPFLVKAMIQAGKIYVLNKCVYQYRINHKINIFNKQKIIDVLMGIKDCLILSSETKMAKLHINSANTLYDTYYPFSMYFLGDYEGSFHKCLFETLLSIDYGIISKGFVTKILDFFGRENPMYLFYKDNEYDGYSVFRAYKQMLCDQKIYSYVEQEFISLANKEGLREVVV